MGEFHFDASYYCNIRTATFAPASLTPLQSIVRSSGLCKTRAIRRRGICKPCWDVQFVLVQPRLKSSRKYANCSYLWYVTNNLSIQGSAVFMKPYLKDFELFTLDYKTANRPHNRCSSPSFSTCALRTALSKAASI